LPPLGPLKCKRHLSLKAQQSKGTGGTNVILILLSEKCNSAPSTFYSADDATDGDALYLA